MVRGIGIKSALASLVTIADANRASLDPKMVAIKGDGANLEPAHRLPFVKALEQLFADLVIVERL